MMWAFFRKITPVLNILINGHFYCIFWNHLKRIREQGENKLPLYTYYNCHILIPNFFTTSLKNAAQCSYGLVTLNSTCILNQNGNIRFSLTIKIYQSSYFSNKMRHIEGYLIIIQYTNFPTYENCIFVFLATLTQNDMHHSSHTPF